jgi:hypothetical protein
MDYIQDHICVNYANNNTKSGPVSTSYSVTGGSSGGTVFSQTSHNNMND